MAIPALTTDGFLPEGVHDCTLPEIRLRFGQFQRSDRRCRLFEKVEQYVRDAIASGVIKAVIFDGSFVTDKEEPNDVDLIVVSLSKDSLPELLRPMEYNVLSKRHIRRNFGLDVLLAQEGQMELGEHVEFFSQVRNRPGIRKGMLRLVL